MAGEERIGFCVARLCRALLLTALTMLPAAAGDVTCAEWVSCRKVIAEFGEYGYSGG
jgi:hypothetical protein